MLSRGWTIPCLAGIAVALGVFGPLPPAAADEHPSEARIDAIMAAMAAEAEQFDAAELHAMGLAGLSPVLDHLLPDTAWPEDSQLSDQAVAAIIRQLGDEKYRVRARASARLLELGPAVRGPLVAAVRGEDVEIAWRARRILQRWNDEKQEDKSPYVAGFAAYAGDVRDEPRIAELARRTKLALAGGVPGGGRYHILMRCIMVVARSDKDEHAALLRPLLKHQDLQVAVMVTEAAGAASQGRECSVLLLDALRQDRAEVVTEALRWSSGCADGPRTVELRRRLTAIFAGDDESLKFQVCYPLMRGFDDRAARHYLLAQIGEGQQYRARALAWIGDPSNLGRGADAALLGALRPMLNSSDHRERRKAIDTLAVYSGEEVVKTLIPCLADPNASIAERVKYRLQHQRDKQMLYRLLAAAADRDPNEKIRGRAAEMLDMIR